MLLQLASGAQAVVTSHWSTATFAPQEANGLEIYGTQGAIQAAPIQAKDSAGTLRVITAGGAQDFAVAAGGVRPHVALLTAFGQAVTSGTPVPVPGEEGLAGLAVVEAAYQSAQCGTRINIRIVPL